MGLPPFASSTRNEDGWLDASPRLRRTVLSLLFLTGLVLRLIDLTDQPLDFHPTRQLRGAILARAMYYELQPEADPETRSKAMALAATLEAQEPPFLETLVAWGSLARGEESPWLARAINAAFWMGAGVVLYRLARRMMNADGAVVAVGFFWTLPFAVFASRSFQPEALMVLCFVGTVYALRRWHETPTWVWALASGLLAGLTVLTKGRVALMVLLVVVAVVVSRRGLRRAPVEPMAWAMAAVMIGIPSVYYLGVIGPSSLGWISTTSGDFLWLSLEPSFYIRWLRFTDSMVRLPLVVFALVGTLLMSTRSRAMQIGMWAGFVVYGVTLPYTIVTHNYYSLPLVPVVALGLGPTAAVILAKVSDKGRWVKILSLGLAALSVAYPAFLTRSALVGNDYRGEAGGWAEIGQALPTDGRIIAVTQDYGYRLIYYGWRQVELWPSRADMESFALQGHNADPDFVRSFNQRTAGFRYFLITNFGEFEGQPDLKAHLEANFPIARQGPTFVVYDLAADE